MNENKIASRVAASFLIENAADASGLGSLSRSRSAKVFPSEEAMNKYLSTRPKADKSKHSVKGAPSKGKKAPEKGKGDAKGKGDDSGKPGKKEAPESKPYGLSGDKAEAVKHAIFNGIENPSSHFDKKSDKEKADVLKKMVDAVGEKKAISILKERIKDSDAANDSNSTAFGKPNSSSTFNKKQLQSALDSLQSGTKSDNTDGKPSKDMHKKKSVSPKAVAKVQNVMKDNGLTNDSDEMKELAHFKTTLGQRLSDKEVKDLKDGTGVKKFVRNVPKLKADFLKNMNPANYASPEAFKAAKDRMKKMPAGDFAKILAAMVDGEEM